MIALVIYYDKSDDIVLSYVKDFAEEIYIYSPEEKIAPPGFITKSGSLENVLDELKGKIDFVAFKARNNYSLDTLKIGDLEKEIKKRNYRILIIH